jgi:hypothetical protein
MLKNPIRPTTVKGIVGEVQPIDTTFSLKGELGWRKIAMSAYDEGSISVRGGEEGDACTHRSDPTEY